MHESQPNARIGGLFASELKRSAPLAFGAKVLACPAL